MIILLLVFLTVTAGTGWAGDICDEAKWKPYCTKEGLFSYDINGNVTYGPAEDPCLAKMEAAMRAMDKYTPNTVATFTLEVATAMVYKKATKKSLEQMIPLYDAVEKQWEETKRECWKDKP